MQASKLELHFMETQKTDDAFDSFYSCVVTECKDLIGETTSEEATEMFGQWFSRLHI